MDWQRPINWAAEWTDSSTDLILKRGQPLFSLMFESDPQNGIDLKYSERTPALDKAISSAIGVAKMSKGTVAVTKQAAQRRPQRLLV
jgi:hypothetical protein